MIDILIQHPKKATFEKCKTNLLQRLLIKRYGETGGGGVWTTQALAAFECLLQEESHSGGSSRTQERFLCMPKTGLEGLSLDGFSNAEAPLVSS